jgi:hypothetical protein
MFGDQIYVCILTRKKKYTQQASYVCLITECHAWNFFALCKKFSSANRTDQCVIYNCRIAHGLLCVEISLHVHGRKDFLLLACFLTRVWFSQKLCTHAHMSLQDGLQSDFERVVVWQRSLPHYIGILREGTILLPFFFPCRGTLQAYKRAWVYFAAKCACVRACMHACVCTCRRKDTQHLVNGWRFFCQNILEPRMRQEKHRLYFFSHAPKKRGTKLVLYSLSSEWCDVILKSQSCQSACVHLLLESCETKTEKDRRIWLEWRNEMRSFTDLASRTEREAIPVPKTRRLTPPGCLPDSSSPCCILQDASPRKLWRCEWIEGFRLMVPEELNAVVHWMVPKARSIHRLLCMLRIFSIEALLCSQLITQN